MNKSINHHSHKDNDSVSLIGSDNPYKIAMKDISDYLRSQKLQIIDDKGDVWIVTPIKMANKETRKLNKELGLHKINKLGRRINRFNNS